MITLAATDTLAGVAGTATAITYTIYGMELSSGVEVYKKLAQGQLPTSAATIYTAPASTQTFIKGMHLANVTGSAVSGVILFNGGLVAGNQITGSLTIPANGWATCEEDGWRVYTATGQLLGTGGVSTGTTPAVLFSTAAAAGVSTNFVRSDDTLNASRLSLPAESRGWQFLGTATGAATTIGPVIWTATMRQIMIIHFVAGYNGGTPIGRILFGSASISTTAANNGTNIHDQATGAAASASTTCASIPGIPMGATGGLLQRGGVFYVDGASGSFKTYYGHGWNSTVATLAVATPPSYFTCAGAFTDLGTNLPLLRAQMTVYDTLVATAASSQQFLTGSYISVWGRNND